MLRRLCITSRLYQSETLYGFRCSPTLQQTALQKSFAACSFDPRIYIPSKIQQTSKQRNSVPCSVSSLVPTR